MQQYVQLMLKLTLACCEICGTQQATGPNSRLTQHLSRWIKAEGVLSHQLQSAVKMQLRSRHRSKHLCTCTFAGT